MKLILAILALAMAAPTAFAGDCNCANPTYYFFKYDLPSEDGMTPGTATTDPTSSTPCAPGNNDDPGENPIKDWKEQNGVTISDFANVYDINNIEITLTPNTRVEVKLPDNFYVVEGAHQHKGGNDCFPGSHSECANTAIFDVTNDKDGKENDISHVAFIFKHCPTGSSPGGNGDPHFTRWAHSERDSFHGECDLVMVRSEQFHDGLGFDLHARTTIDSFYSYIESGAFRVCDYTVEMERDHFYINGKEHTSEDLPLTFGGEYMNTIRMTKKSPNVREYEVELDRMAKIVFKFYKHFLSITLPHFEASDAVGILGRYGSGELVNRDGVVSSTFEEHGFEWQVIPEVDGQLFRDARAPQLPYERCRMPTAARPSRRMLRADNALHAQAEKACADLPANDFQLCIDDVMMTGDVGLAEGAW